MTADHAAQALKTGMEPHFYRPCWVEINTQALEANVKALRFRLADGVGILAMVKADAYGHGLVACAQAALRAGAGFLGVSSLEEGIALREAEIEAPILILGTLYPLTNFPVLFDYKLSATVASLETAEALSAIARERQEKLNVHLKIDSGFGRIGVSWARGAAFVRDVSRLPGLTLEGLYTHFSSADENDAWTQTQSERFLGVVQDAAKDGIRPPYIHMANSAALLKFPSTHGTLVRPGIALYGIAPYPNPPIGLVPVLTWKSRIIFLKQWPEGAGVSYAQTWTAKRPTQIATLAVGYADGFPRSLGNAASVIIRGKRAPVIGRVTMDMTMVDVTDTPDCRVGDEAVLIGTQGGQTILAGEMAAWAQTNSYEIVSRIAARVPRIYPHG